MITIPSGIFSINRPRRAAYSSLVNWAAKREDPSNKIPKAIMNKNRIRLIIATSFLIPYHADTKKASKTQDAKNFLFFRFGFNFDLFSVKIPTIEIYPGLFTRRDCCSGKEVVFEAVRYQQFL
jgi:hypothetical protein